MKNGIKETKDKLIYDVDFNYITLCISIKRRQTKKKVKAKQQQNGMRYLGSVGRFEFIRR